MILSRDCTFQVTPHPFACLVVWYALQVPAHLVAALHFRGHVRGSSTVNQRKKELLDILKVTGMSMQFTL